MEIQDWSQGENFEFERESSGRLSAFGLIYMCPVISLPEVGAGCPWLWHQVEWQSRSSLELSTSIDYPLNSEQGQGEISTGWLSTMDRPPRQRALQVARWSAFLWKARLEIGS